MQLSPGSWTVIVLAVCSSVAISVWPVPVKPGQAFWTFALEHTQIYDPAIAAWNRTHPKPADHVNDYVISGGALGRRLASGFLSGTPVPDMVEVETGMVSSFFSGPLDAVGFTDLTERIHREGLDQQINAPSFSPWTNRGHIFGLPHDVHPVLLAYRADVVEAAGIDMSKIETWNDFVRVMSPLVRTSSESPRYLINVWDTDAGDMEILLLQAGGQYFDDDLRPVLNSEINARVLCTIVSWVTGPHRICMNAPGFDAEGNYLFLHGSVLCTLMPDWLTGIWMRDLSGLSGKIKLMPMPAWEKGGRRTSCLGGTMMAIPKRAPDFERSWAFAKHLYLDRDVARALFRITGIISPVRAFWSDPIYDEPNPYFSNQAVGRIFISQAPDVPLRTSSPYQPQAATEVNDALMDLRRYADEKNIFDVAALMPQARLELDRAQRDLQRQMAANVFLQPAAGHE